MTEITAIELGLPGLPGVGVSAGQFAGLGKKLQAEESSTPVAGGSTDAPGADLRRYAFVQLPTDYDLYVITGIEWKNGATLDGDVYCGVEIVDADPPVATETSLVAWAKRQQSGISAVQRLTRITSLPIVGGTRLGVWFNPSSGTATFAYSSATSGKNNRNVTATTEPSLVLSGGWGNSTKFYYVKLYYRGLL